MAKYEDYNATQKTSIAEAMSGAWIDGASRLLSLNLASVNLSAAILGQKLKGEFGNISEDNVKNFIEQINVVLFHLKNLQDEIDYIKTNLEAGISRLKKWTV